MLDQIQQLEGRVETLMRLLEKVRQENGQLRAENQSLHDQLAVLAAERERSGQLQNQVRQLESELEGVAGRETQIRDRLKVILGKIDSIEQEISHAGGE